MHYKIGVTCVLYENIDQILPNILHRPMHDKTGVTCVLYENIDQILPVTWTNALQNTCYMCIQLTRVLYSVVIA